MKPYYQDDWVTIYHGDCREVLPLMGRFDVLLADPPYGINYVHGARKGGVLYGADGRSVVGDDRPFDPSHLLSVAGKTILWGANHYSDKLPASPGWLIWDKRDGGPHMDQSDTEMAWTDFLTVCRTFHRRWSGACRGGREQRERRVHSNQKPVALMAWALSWTGDSVSVIDPYMGSGATLIAAKETGRRGIGIEIEERYCEIAAERCSQEVLNL